MKISSLLSLLTIGISCNASPINDEAAGPIQLVTPVENSLEQNIEEIKLILGANNTEDRQLVTELVHYLQSYLNMFNGDTLPEMPEPKSILMVSNFCRLF